jgi:peptidoglycan/LPS O-acetylase OafA/YrhL
MTTRNAVSPSVETTGEAEPRNVQIRYWPALDGIRALAVLAVLGVHIGLTPAGFFGVDVFFVLSGFLITMLLLDEHRRTGNIRLRSFYLRRAVRLLPAALVVLGFTVLGGYLVLEETERNTLPGSVIAVLTYTANFHVLAAPMPMLSHYWSLSMEEQFYFVWPLVLIGLLFIKQMSVRLIAYLSGFVALASAFAGIGVVLAGGPPEGVGSLPQTRAYGLLMGCALAAVLTGRMLPISQRLLKSLRMTGVASIILFALILRPFPRSETTAALIGSHGGSLVVSVITIVIIASIVLDSDETLLSRGLSVSPLVVIGRWSYALYLVHFPIFVLLMHTGWPDIARIPSSIVVSILAAALLHYAVEKPSLRLKAHYASRAARHSPPVAAAVSG